MRSLFLIIPLFLSCKSENEVRLQRREIRTNQNTYDAGITAVGDRYTFAVILQSIGLGPITITDIQSSDPDHFVVLDSWKQEDLDGDNFLDGLVLEGASEEDPAQAVVEINFRPDVEGNFRAKLTIISNDSTTEERTEDGQGIWRAAMRGVGKIPCLRILPSFYDYGEKPPGGYFSSNLTLQNCGRAPLTISSFDFDGSESFYAASATPIYILANDEEIGQIAWIPANNQPESVSVSLVVNDPYFDQEIIITGNNCEDSTPEFWDLDEDGWTVCGGDCNDDDPTINPEAQEIQGNLIDDNCNELIDADDITDILSDEDNDGYTESEGDCNDYSADISPEALEIPNNTDDNCNGIIDEDTIQKDDDGDGWSEREGDCNDNDALIFPDTEDVENSIDDDCDGFIDEGSVSYDDDGDGVNENEGDCDDNDPWTFPSAEEDCDNVDNNCNDLIDEGEEGEGTTACGFIVDRIEIKPVEDGCNISQRNTVGWSGLLLSLLGFGFARRQQFTKQ